MSAEPLITINTQLDEKLEFYDMDTFAKWFEDADSSWSWYLENSLVSNTPFKQELRASFESIRNGLNKKSKDGKINSEHGFELIHSGISKYQKQIGILPSNARVKYAENASKDDPEAAGFLVEFLSGKHVANNLNSRPIAKAFFLSLWFDVDPNSVPDAQHKALDNLNNEYIDRLNSNEEKFETIRTENVDVVRRSRNFLEKCNHAFKVVLNWSEDMKNDVSNQFREEIDVSKERISEFEEAVNNKIALLHPIEYWEKKASEHGVKAAWYFGVFGLLLAFGIIVMFAFSRDLVAMIVSSDAPYSVSFFLIAMGGIFVWPMRIVAKIGMSNLHQATDFEERATLIKTYIGFQENHHIGNNAEYGLVLFQAIFRPSATGIVKEDGQSSVFQDFMNNLIKKQP